jgi:hypothetical protein
MDPIEIKQPSYPALSIVARHGRPLAMVVAVLIVVAGGGLSLAEGATLRALAWLVAGIAVYAISRVLVELIEVITEMLLPK